MSNSRTCWGGNKPEIYERSFATMCAGGIPFILRSAPGRSLIDVGCGAGHLSEAAAKLGYSVHAIDAEEKMIELTRRRCEGLDVRATVAELPQLDGVERESAEVVACSFVVNHLTDPAAGVKTLAALARPGGHIITTVWPMTFTAHRSITTGVMDEVGARRTDQDQVRPSAIGAPRHGEEGSATPAGDRAPSATGLVRGVMDELRIPDLPQRSTTDFEHSPRGLAELSTRAGLHVDTATMISWTWRISWQNYLAGVQGGIAGVGERYQRQDPDTQRAIDARLLEAMTPYGAPDLLRLPCRAAFCVATKPGRR